MNDNSKPLLLGVDSSTSLVSLGISQNGQTIGEVTFYGMRRQLGKMIPWLDLLLKETGRSLADLGGIACVTGPGSFSGLRIGLATVQGLALSLKIPVLELCSLDVFARETPYGNSCVLTHSQSCNYFHATYRDAKRQGDIALAPIEKILDELISTTLLVSPHIEKFSRNLVEYRVQKTISVVPVTISGARVAKLGENELKKGRVCDPLQLKPRYLRGSFAEEKYGQKTLS